MADKRQISNNTKNQKVTDEKMVLGKNNESGLHYNIPSGSMILGEGAYYSTDCYKTQLNNNVVVVGTSGAGKTRGIVIPMLLQAEGSYIISDPKGNLAREYGPYLEEKGYTIVKMDFIHPGKSMRYNPITRCKTPDDALKLASSIVFELGGIGGRWQDPFWPKSEQMFIVSLISYLAETSEISEEDKNISMLIKLAHAAKRYDKNGSSSRLSEIMEDLEFQMRWNGKESFAAGRFRDFNTAPEKTHNTIIITALSDLCMYDTPEMRKMTSGNDIDFTAVGREKTAVFVEVSDTDRSKDMLVNLFYSQMMNELCSYADEHCPDSRLPIPVRFILDDFATNARINNFENIISNIRSRNISTMIFLQSEAQLAAKYGENAQTIIDNCNTYVYMGGSDPDQARKVSLRANKDVNTILNMPLMYSWIFRRGQEPLLCHNIDLEKLEKDKGYFKPKLAEEKTEEPIRS